MNKKKILHLIQSLDSGGCENMLLRTLPLLTDFEHTIITLKKRGSLADKFEEKGISVTNIGQRNLFDIFSYRRLLKNVKKNKPGLIITYLFHADAIGRIFLQTATNVKIVPFLRTTYNHRRYWPARLFEKTTRHFAREYLANSESVKSFYVKNMGVPAKKITVIPNGIDVDFYDSIPRDENFRRELGINPEDTAIVCVANLHISKGHKYLLDAFEEVYRQNKKNKLLLAGDGEEKENLLKQTENYQSKNSIIFLGKRNDVPKILKISDIFVLPTLFEGMSNAIMEAMASGLPVIATNIPANLEIIENKKNGILVSTEDSGALARAISHLAGDSNLRTALGRSARIRCRNDFDLGKITAKLKELYNVLA